jgi:hypothetical protein
MQMTIRQIYEQVELHIIEVGYELPLIEPYDEKLLHYLPDEVIE